MAFHMALHTGMGLKEALSFHGGFNPKTKVVPETTALDEAPSNLCFEVLLLHCVAL